MEFICVNNGNLLSCTVSEIWRTIGSIFAIDRGGCLSLMHSFGILEIRDCKIWPKKVESFLCRGLKCISTSWTVYRRASRVWQTIALHYVVRPKMIQLFSAHLAFRRLLFFEKSSCWQWRIQTSSKVSRAVPYYYSYIVINTNFYRAACNADAVLWWEFCPSVCPSVTRVYCDKTVERSIQIYIPYERAFSLVFWEEEWLVGGDPFYLEFWVNRPPLERNRRFSTNNRS